MRHHPSDAPKNGYFCKKLFPPLRRRAANIMSSKSIARAREALRKSASMFRQKVDAALPISLTKEGREKRREFAATPGSLADDEARLLAGDILIDELAKHHKRTKNTNTRHFLVTFCWDAGVLSVDPPYDLKLKAMRLKVYKALQKVGLQGVGAFEVAPLRGSKGAPPRFLVHVHFQGWTNDRRFQPRAAAKALIATGAFPNSFGAPAVTILSRKMAAKNFRAKDSEVYDHLFSDLHRDQTKASLTWLGYYLLQAPAYVKQVCPDKRKPGETVMRSNYKNYSPQLALALDRLLNEIPFPDAVFSVGKEGRLVGAAWRKEFKDRTKKTLARTEEKARRGRASKAKVRRRRSKLLKRLQRDEKRSSRESSSNHSPSNQRIL